MKEALLIVLFLAVWFSVGVIDAGYTNGYFQGKYPEFNNNSMIVVSVIAGPLGLLGTWQVCGFNKFNLHWSTKEERWKAYHERFPHLDRQSFEETENK